MPNFRDSYLLYWLAVTSHVLSKDFHKVLKKKGIKIAKWRVLGVLQSQKDIMLTELARHVLFEQSRLTKIIDQLEQEGLLVKQRLDDDRRKLALNITPKGSAIVIPLMEQARKHEAQVMSTLTRPEQKQIMGLLQKLVKPHWQKPARQP